MFKLISYANKSHRL